MGQQRLNQQKTAAPTRPQSTKTSVKSPLHPVEELQAAIGNREMNRLLETNRLPHPSSPFPKQQGELPLLGGMMLVSHGTIQRQPLFRGLSQELTADTAMALPATGAVIQPKLTLGTPGDMYEEEADRVARQVVDEIHSSPFREKNALSEEERIPAGGEAGRVQRQRTVRSAGDAGGELSSEWEGELQRAKGGGQPLSPSVKEPMERAFGADFGGVRVHTGAQADGLARSIQAKAFTTGQDVYFRQGAYEPGSRGGQELIAHELTHVGQQIRLDERTMNHPTEKKQIAQTKEPKRREKNQSIDLKVIEYPKANARNEIQRMKNQGSSTKPKPKPTKDNEGSSTKTKPRVTKVTEYYLYKSIKNLDSQKGLSEESNYTNEEITSIKKQVEVMRENAMNNDNNLQPNTEEWNDYLKVKQYNWFKALVNKVKPKPVKPLENEIKVYKDQPNPAAKDIHQLVREKLGYPTNAEWNANTAVYNERVKAYTEEEGEQANNINNEILTRMSFTPDKIRQVRSGKDVKEKRTYMIVSAAVGSVTGAGICDIFGAMSAILLRMKELPHPMYVGTDSHNFASYGDRNLVDPWKNLEHKNERAFHEEIVYDLSNEEPTQLWEDYKSAERWAMEIYQKIMANEETAYKSYRRSEWFEKKRKKEMKRNEEGEVSVVPRSEWYVHPMDPRYPKEREKFLVFWKGIENDMMFGRTQDDRVINEKLTNYARGDMEKLTYIKAVLEREKFEQMNRGEVWKVMTEGLDVPGLWESETRMS